MNKYFISSSIALFALFTACNLQHTLNCEGTTGKLHDALEQQNLVQALAIVEKEKINPEAICTAHTTPVLHKAATLGYHTLVKLLVERGAFVDTLDNNQRTPLMEAATNGHLNVVSVILGHKKRFNQHSALYQEALRLAEKNNKKEAVEHMLRNLSLVDQQDNKGNTALMEALSSPQAAGNIPLVKMIMDMTQDFTLKNNLGLTALDIATNNYKHAAENKSRHKLFYCFWVAQLKQKS